jgi:hypothetical protein
VGNSRRVRTSEDALRIYFGLLMAETRAALASVGDRDHRRRIGQQALDKLARAAELAPAGELRTKTYAMAEVIAINLDLRTPWKDASHVE